MAQDQPFYVGQKALIDKDGKLLILNDPYLGYDLPGGKLQIGETDFEKALKREVKEETNLEIDVISPFATWYFEIPKDSRHPRAGIKVFTISYKCKYKAGEIRLSSEHDNYIWIDKDSFTTIKNDWKSYPIIEKYFSYK